MATGRVESSARCDGDNHRQEPVADVHGRHRPHQWTAQDGGARTDTSAAG
ncbi:hypothetical protein ACFPN0_32185 [Kitasatospora cinereorecta]